MAKKKVELKTYIVGVCLANNHPHRITTGKISGILLHKELV